MVRSGEEAHRSPRTSLPARSWTLGAAVIGVTAVAAAAAAAAAARAIRGLRRSHRYRRPQQWFRTVYADTTDRPFPHLPPQPWHDDGGRDCGAGGGGGSSIAADHTNASGTGSGNGEYSVVAVTSEAAATAVGGGGGGNGGRGAAIATYAGAAGLTAVTPLPSAADADGTAGVDGTAGAGGTDRAASMTIMCDDNGAVAAAAAAAAAAVKASAPTAVDATATPAAGAVPPAAAAAGGSGTGGCLVHPYLGRIQRLMGAPECPVRRLAPQPPGATAAGLPAGYRVHWVATGRELQRLGQRLRQARQIGLDTEASAVASYHGVVCLLQLSVGASDSGGGGGGGGGSGGEVWLVDTLALHDAVGPALGGLMADPQVVKVVHGGSNDVTWLQRDFRLYLVNVFDTEKASQVLGYDSRALAALLLRHVGVDLTAEKAAGQRADWRRRPLPPPLLRYAAADVAYLPYLADVLRRELAAVGPGWPALPPAIAHLTWRPGKGGHMGSTATEGSGGGGGGRGGDSVNSVTTHAEYVSAPLVTFQAVPSSATVAAAAAAAPGSGQGSQPVGRPVPTPLGHALLRSHQLSLTLYRKPLSDAATTAAALAAASGSGSGTPPVGTASAAAAAILRKFFSAATGTTATATATAAPSVAPQPVAEGGQGSISISSNNSNNKSNSSSSGRQAVAATPPATTGTAACTAGAAADAVYALCRWRDSVARRVDVGPQALLPDAAVAALSAMRPPPPDRRGLVRVVEERIAALNEALKAEPYAVRYDVCTEVRRQADALVRLLATTAAGKMPAGPLGQLSSGPAVAGAVAAAGGLMAGMGRRTRHDPEAALERRTWLIEKFSAKGQVYQNCRMLSREGQLLCFCDVRKLNWYLSKGLAVQVCEEPPTIQLLFEHQNTDQQMGADDFYTQSKANRCVACGCTSHYLRYRVLPACYRRHMPPALKSHRSHDVVLLCIDCHERAQKAAEALKRRVASDYGVPLLPPRTALPPPVSASATSSTPSLMADAGRTPVGGSGDDAYGSADALYDGGGGDDDGGDGGGDGDEGDGGGGGEGGGGRGEDWEGLPGGVHPSAARRAALALQKSGGKMPIERVRQLEAVIKTALGRDPSAEAPGLPPGDVQAALLAGLGRRGRRKYNRAQQQQQQQQQQRAEEEQAQAEEAAPLQEQQEQRQDEADGAAAPATAVARQAAATAATAALAAAAATAATAADRWLDSGHLWHGERVVRLAMQRGGEEELLQLIKRFRACFVEAVRPQFLPPAWEVDHAARRDFGPYSVYAAQRRRQQQQQQQPGQEHDDEPQEREQQTQQWQEEPQEQEQQTQKRQQGQE